MERILEELGKEKEYDQNVFKKFLNKNQKY